MYELASTILIIEADGKGSRDELGGCGQAAANEGGGGCPWVGGAAAGQKEGPGQGGEGFYNLQ